MVRFASAKDAVDAWYLADAALRQCPSVPQKPSHFALNFESRCNFFGSGGKLNVVVPLKILVLETYPPFFVDVICDRAANVQARQQAILEP